MQIHAVALLALTLAVTAPAGLQAQTPEPAPADSAAAPREGSIVPTAPAPSDTAAAPPPFRIEMFPRMDEKSKADRGERITIDMQRDPDDPWDGWRNGSRRAHLFNMAFDSGLRYNRVEGLALEVGTTRSLARGSWLPAYEAAFSYAFAAKRGLFRLGFEQPLVPSAKLTLGATGYRQYRAFFYGYEILANGENSASAFFLHRDYRDWYETDGGRAWFGVYPSPFLSATVGVTSEDQTSLDQATDWSLFRQKADFRTNPDVREGRFRAWDATLAYDSRPGARDGEPRPRSTWGRIEHLHRLTWERADPGLDGDFDLWRVVLDARTYLRLSHQQMLSGRLLVGTGSDRDGLLPPQRRFLLGGVGTLRGHDFHALSGDRAVMANLEYDFEMFEDHRGIVFVDAGTAWDRGDFTDQKIDVDVGAGFRFGEDGLSILAARNVNRSDEDLKVSVRFQNTF